MHRTMDGGIRENTRPSTADLTLGETIELARKAAWKGARIDRFFHGQLEFATAGECHLVFLDGEYVGEIGVDPMARERSLLRGCIRVYHEFNPRHQFYYVSDPRRFAPGFPDSLGRLPSRDTAAIALLDALMREGKLRRFESGWGRDRGSLQRLDFTSASLAAPWFRIWFDGRELGWLMAERNRSHDEGRWFYVGPPALGPHRHHGFYRSRDEAALALVGALRVVYRDRPRRFEATGDGGLAGSAAWNRVASELAAALEHEGDEPAAVQSLPREISRPTRVPPRRPRRGGSRPAEHPA